MFPIATGSAQLRPLAIASDKLITVAITLCDVHRSANATLPYWASLVPRPDRLVKVA
jgi:hypothetical protein